MNNEENRILIDNLTKNNNYGYLELEDLAEDIREWIKEDREK